MRGNTGFAQGNSYWMNANIDGGVVTFHPFLHLAFTYFLIYSMLPGMLVECVGAGA